MRKHNTYFCTRRWGQTAVLGLSISKSLALWMQPSLLLSSYQQEKTTGIFSTTGCSSTGGAAFQWLQFTAPCADPGLSLERPLRLPAPFGPLTDLCMNQLLTVLFSTEFWRSLVCFNHEHHRFPLTYTCTQHILSIQSTATRVTFSAQNSNHVVSIFKP